jgi:electron transfer flavoprotein alpha subunit
MEDRADIIIVADAMGDRVDPTTYEMLAFARRLQALAAGRIRIWMLGEASEDAAREVARRCGVNVTVLRCPGLSHYQGEAFRSLLVPALAATAPRYVITVHSSGGAEWAPAVAARLDAGCIGGVDGLGTEDGRIWFSKDRYGGKVKGRYASDASTTVLTVQPGCFPFQNRPEENRSAEKTSGRVTVETMTWQPEQTRLTGVMPAVAKAANLKDAQIVVAAGNGIGAEENLQWIYGLAERLPKAMVAGTRILCDRGWLGYDRQVGVTGVSVAPALYIACGISGASQHVMGMRGSGFVIAINADPQAAICSEADVCIVADINVFIPMVLEVYEKQKAQQNGA